MVVIENWADLQQHCPLKLERVNHYYQQFYTYLPSKIDENDLGRTKENLFVARGNLDSMFSSLIQILYDREILEKSEDKILFAWLIDNIGRYLKRLDSKEFDLMIKHDSPVLEKSNVGLSRISAYWKLLQTSVDSLIYDSLVKATIEYLDLPKEKKELRTFLYILFQVLNVTMAIMGGLSREETHNKKGMVHAIPTTYQSLMGDAGKKIIQEGYKEDTGIDVGEFKEDLDNLNIEGDLDDTENS